MSPEAVAPERLLRRHRFQALGSACELLAVDAPMDALQRGEVWIRQAEARFSRFEARSELNHLNHCGGAWVSISAPMVRMLTACQHAYTHSQGLVNAAVLPALLAAGYSRRFAAGLEVPADFRPQPVPPLADVLELDADRHRARLKPGTGLDFGGIAKGQLADELAERLGKNVLCNLGGDLRARGDGLGDGWQVGLPNGRTVALRDGALGTSGTTRRRWGTSFHHLIDPRTGAPSRTDVALVSVAAADALSAEIYAKTALFLGTHEGRRFLEARGLYHLLLPEGARHDA